MRPLCHATAEVIFLYDVRDMLDFAKVVIAGVDSRPVDDVQVAVGVGCEVYLLALGKFKRLFFCLDAGQDSKTIQIRWRITWHRHVEHFACRSPAKAMELVVSRAIASSTTWIAALM